MQGLLDGLGAALVSGLLLALFAWGMHWLMKKNDEMRKRQQEKKARESQTPKGSPP